MGVTVREKEKGSGEWWVFINIGNKRRSKKIGKRSAANAIKSELEYKISKKQFEIGENEGVTFYEYGKKWLENFVKVRRSPLTYTRYSGLLEQKIKKHIGNIDIKKVSRGDIKKFLLSEFKNGSAASSVNLMLNVISGIMDSAIDDEIIVSNPASAMTRRLDIARDKKKAIKPLSSAQMAIVLESIRLNEAKYYPLFLTLFRTGARIGEICALEWNDIDFNAATISISKTAKDQAVKKNTKTYTARIIEIPSVLLCELKKLKKEAPVECSYVFNTNGRLYAQNTIRRAWERSLARVDINRRRLHDIRHTTASLLLAKGAPLTAVCYLLGHSSAQITLKVYAKYMPSENAGFTGLLD